MFRLNYLKSEASYKIWEARQPSTWTSFWVKITVFTQLQLAITRRATIHSIAIDNNTHSFGSQQNDCHRSTRSCQGGVLQKTPSLQLCGELPTTASTLRSLIRNLWSRFTRSTSPSSNTQTLLRCIVGRPGRSTYRVPWMVIVRVSSSNTCIAIHALIADWYDDWHYLTTVPL